MSGKRAHIIGAGFSGLTTAYFLIKQGWEVEIFERGDHVGGLIQTKRNKYGLVETAANGILNSKLLEDLCAEVGVELQAAKKTARARYIFRRGQPRRWPWTFKESLALLRFIFLYLFFRSQVKPKPQETVRQWGLRCLGFSLCQYSVETVLQGIYGNETEHLSASLVLAFLFKKREPLPRPQLGRGTVAPKNGMGEFTQKLSDFLTQKKVLFHFNCDLRLLAQLTSYASSPATVVVIATSASEAARLLKNSNDPQFEFLKKSQMKPLSTSTVFWKTPALPYPGFGILVPKPEGLNALGVLRPDLIFAGRAQSGLSAETWIWPWAEANTSGGVWAELIQKEHKQVSASPGVFPGAFPDAFLDEQTTSWPEALPFYGTDWEKALSERPQATGPVYLIGNYLGEIGLKSILERAQNLALQISATNLRRL